MSSVQGEEGRGGGRGALPRAWHTAGPQHRVGVTADGAYVWRRRELSGTDVGGGLPVSEGSRAPCRWTGERTSGRLSLPLCQSLPAGRGESPRRW